ncbi:hypothetical protein ACEK07_49640 [Alcanivoracaceae bacterium MT1]
MALIANIVLDIRLLQPTRNLFRVGSDHRYHPSLLCQEAHHPAFAGQKKEPIRPPFADPGPV